MSLFEEYIHNSFKNTESYVSVKVDWLKIMWVRVKRVYNKGDKPLQFSYWYLSNVRSIESASVMIPCSENERKIPPSKVH